MFGMQVDPQPPIDVYYTAGEVIAFGGYEVRPHHTPGHCPGGVCLQIGVKGEAGKELFVGDTLFAGSIGRTDLPGGDFDRADRLDPQRPLRVRRRGDRAPGARAGHDHRQGTADQPVSAERLTAEHAESAWFDKLTMSLIQSLSKDALSAVHVFLSTVSSTRPTRRRSPAASVAF